MAATITKTEETLGTVKKITWEWTSHTDGSVATTTTNAATTNYYDGEILRFTTDPSGTAAPTDDYDVYIYDDDGFDVLVGAGVNRDTSNNEQAIASSLAAISNSKLTLQVANAGDTKSGTVNLYIR